MIQSNDRVDVESVTKAPFNKDTVDFTSYRIMPHLALVKVGPIKMLLISKLET
eukprot:CAMPEP_0178493732 /NCGR_PEP_ID=MMETSP0696-20121128/12633_1 /TAXON_ID=265572 /ORGANISM="Extubocellulus spinifer, Strain CCMP396" /LENGTH=52 /DNA_ID=CAMNT_0020121753 /DNA_START=410 /DNA_END=564 /DNA_ORIENTATION=+